MKLGDLVKFTDEHSSKPGFDYTVGWKGIVIAEAPDLAILWSTPHGETIGGLDAGAAHILEVISESR